MRHTKRQKQFEESEQTSEPDTDMIGMLNLPAWEFKITMINMIRALVNKRDRMQEQMVNVNRETEMLRKNQKQLLEILKKTIIIELKNAFEEFISRMHKAEERISELKDNTIENFKTEKQNKKKARNQQQNRVSKNYGITTKSIIYT